MGVGYRAEDTGLGRQVALESLPADIVRERPALQRFNRGAPAAAPEPSEPVF